ncbi:hypothetical protein QE454_001807 [Microbacterium sp. SORGH_AS454]|nr:hypothetical protein [Microbacterium sp. SORGH_AS_0454]
MTHASTPAGTPAATVSRTCSTTSRTSPGLSIGTKICAARPSSETTGGEASPDTPSTAATSVARPCSAATCASLSALPSEVEATTIAGTVSLPVKSVSRSLTRVASADCGRKDDWSFVAT